jgi:hypothetical protein
MAIPHYAYLNMKLPGPRGVITITGCYKKLMECVKSSSKLAEAFVVSKEKRQLLQRVALTQPGWPALSQPAFNLKPASDAKKIPLEVNKTAKVAVSEVGLSTKSESKPTNVAYKKSRYRSSKPFGPPRQKSCIPNKCR